MQKFALIIIFFLCVAILPAQNNRFYVDPTAFGQNNGQNWYDAFTNLHDALALAVKGDEIWVAQGIYRPSSSNDRDAHFELLSGVRLLGGFAGTEMDVTERNIEAHPSFLDGDIGTLGDTTDNSYNLLYLYRPDSTTFVDGFTFRYALANKPGIAKGLPGVSGSALYMMAVDGSAYPTIQNCTFLYNTSLSDGGAVYVNGFGTGSVAPFFNRCKFLHNQSREGSGGAYTRYGGSWVNQKVDIKECLFEENYAYYFGGGIFFTDSPRMDTFDIIETVAKSNFCNGKGTLSGNFFHVVFARSDDPTVIRLKDCRIENNKVNLLNAALVSQIYFSEIGNTLWIVDSVVFKNNSTPIAGESFSWINYIIKNTVFENEKNGIGNNISQSLKVSEFPTILKNVKISDCGSIFSPTEWSFYSKSMIIDGLTLENNVKLSIILKSLQHESKIKASNILAFKNSSWNSFYPISITGNDSNNNSTLDIYNLSAFENGIYLNSPKTSIQNSIFQASDPKLIYKFMPNNPAIVKNCIITLPDTISNLNWIQSNNLWSTDPMFAAPDSGNFQLQACSPAINAGINDGQLSATDLLGQPRVQFGAVDIGAIEAGPLAFYAPAEITPACTSTSSNGAISVATLDLCAPALYTWSTGASGEDLPAQEGLAPGNYTVTVSDTKGRSVVLSLNVPLALAPQIGIDKQALQCGDTIGGQLAAVINGSTGPYQFNWGFSTDSLVTGLAAGIYQVTVTDRLGCTASASAEVVREGALSLTVNVEPISCFGSNDGGLTILPANGKAPFTWLWDDGSNTPTLAPLGPGIYQGVLTDAFDCKIQWYLPLTEPGLLQLSAQVDPASGPQVADGHIQLDSISGGTMPYSAGWSNGMNGLEINGLLPGMYTCTLTDANGCVATRTFQVPFTNATTSPGQESDYTIYPNPNNGAFTLEGIGQGKMLFEIFDASGKRVWGQDYAATPGSAFTQQIRTNLPAGGYHWSLKTGQTIRKGLLFIQ